MQGQTGAAYYPGETACASITGTTSTCEMEFSSFSAAAAVFASNKGSLVKGVSDPKKFFTNLHTKKGGFSQKQSLAAYLKDALGTEAWIDSCLKTLGLVK
jgi:hypothetical protein